MTEQRVRIIIDQRELSSPVPKALERLGCELHFAMMEVGDYAASDRVAFERKNIDDFMNSWLMEKKLLGQINDLAKAYEKPVLIIEGGNPFFTGRDVHPNAVQGLLNTIAVSFRVPILYANTPADTANIIMMVGKREQIDERRGLSLHGKRSNLNESELKVYVISAIPELGMVKAKNLLTHFGSIEKIATATEEQLTEVPLIGKVAAKRIREIVGGVYFGK